MILFYLTQEDSSLFKEENHFYKETYIASLKITVKSHKSLIQDLSATLLGKITKII